MLCSLNLSTIIIFKSLKFKKYVKIFIQNFNFDNLFIQFKKNKIVNRSMRFLFCSFKNEVK